MKKFTVLVALLILTLLFSSCSEVNGGPETTLPESTGQTDEQTQTMKCEIVKNGGEASVLAAAEEGLFVLDLEKTDITLGGKPAEYAALENGMSISIEYVVIEETYPGIIYPSCLYASSDRNGYYDICSMYMQVISELWEEDAGLNSNGDNIYINLTEAPGLSDAEKEAVIYLTGNLTGKSVSAATFEDLKERAIFNEKELYINGGCYIEISGEEKSGSKLTFNAQKYVSGLGAIFFTECSASWNGSGEWEYTPGGFAIA